MGDIMFLGRALWRKEVSPVMLTLWEENHGRLDFGMPMRFLGTIFYAASFAVAVMAQFQVDGRQLDYYLLAAVMFGFGTLAMMFSFWEIRQFIRDCRALCKLVEDAPEMSKDELQKAAVEQLRSWAESANLTVSEGKSTHQTLQYLTKHYEVCMAFDLVHKRGDGEPSGVLFYLDLVKTRQPA